MATPFAGRIVGALAAHLLLPTRILIGRDRKIGGPESDLWETNSHYGMSITKTTAATIRNEKVDHWVDDGRTQFGIKRERTHPSRPTTNWRARIDVGDRLTQAPVGGRREDQKGFLVNSGDRAG